MSKMARGAGYLTAGTLIFIIAGYATNLWLARHLGPSTYGKYSVLLAVLTVVGIIQNSGPPQALTKQIAKHMDRSRQWLLNGLVLQVAITVLLAVAVIIGSPWLASLLHDPALGNDIRLVGLVFPAYGVYSIFLGYFNGIQAFGRQAILSIAYAIAKTALVIGLAYSWGVTGAMLGFVSAPLLALIAGIVKPQGRINSGFIQKMALDAIPLSAFAFAAMLQLTVDLIMVKSMLPSASAGYYSAAQNVALVPYYSLSAISSVLFPGVASIHHRGDMAQLRRIIHQGLRYLIVMVIPICGLIAAMSRQIVQLLFGKTYTLAAIPLKFLVIAYIFLTLYLLSANILNALDKTYWSVGISLCGVLITIVLCLLLVPANGLVGAAWAVTTAALAILLASLSTVYRVTSFAFPLVTVTKAFIASAVVSIAAISLDPSPLMTPVVFCLGLVAYIILMIAARELTVSDMQLIGRVMPSSRTQ